MSYLSGELSGRPHEWLYWRQGAWKAYRKGDWELVFNPRSRNWELYDLGNDLVESEDLARDNPGKLHELMGEWTELNEQMADALF